MCGTPNSIQMFFFSAISKEGTLPPPWGLSLNANWSSVFRMCMSTSTKFNYSQHCIRYYISTLNSLLSQRMSVAMQP